MVNDEFKKMLDSIVSFWPLILASFVVVSDRNEITFKQQALASYNQTLASRVDKLESMSDSVTRTANDVEWIKQFLIKNKGQQ